MTMAKTWNWYEDKDSLLVYVACTKLEPLRRIFKPVEADEQHEEYKTFEKLLDDSVQFSHDNYEMAEMTEFLYAIIEICWKLEELCGIDRETIEKAYQEAKPIISECESMYNI